MPESVAFVATSDYRLYRFRRRLIDELMSRDCRVDAAVPRGEYAASLEQVGVDVHDWSVRRDTINPARELISVARLARLLRKIRPTVCHTFSLKPNLQGAVAARLAGVPVIVATYTGLGYLFTEAERRSGTLRRAVFPFIRLSSSLCDAVVFQNRDDMQQMLAQGLVSHEKARLMPGGSGVDLDEFSPSHPSDSGPVELKRELGVPEGDLVVFTATRLLWDKGVKELVEAATQIVNTGLKVSFLIAGDTDAGNRASIPAECVERWQKRLGITFLGERKDIASLLRAADIVAFPSYREGMPRFLIEASATGKPLVTTDVPGCREVVDDGVNGMLVPPRDAGLLAAAIRHLASDKLLRERLGGAAREKAVREFDDRLVVHETLGLYAELVARHPGKVITRP